MGDRGIDRDHQIELRDGASRVVEVLELATQIHDPTGVGLELPATGARLQAEDAVAWIREESFEVGQLAGAQVVVVVPGVAGPDDADLQSASVCSPVSTQ